MRIRDKKKILGYIGRFSVVHLVTYCLLATVFLIFQNVLPASERVALDFFEPYRQLSIMVIVNQLLKGAIIALILIPFYNVIINNNRGRLIIFGAIWGLSLLGSVNPMPGSIEGLVYTTTTMTEHLVVLLAGAVQTFLLATIFLYWEEKINGRKPDIDLNKKESNPEFMGYSLRFILVHIVTYVVVGFAFYNLQNYAGALDTMEAFKLYRNLEDPIIASLIIPSQVLRGGLLALFIYPFYSTFIKKKKGWLYLFALLYGFTFAVLFAQDFSETIIEGFSITEMLIGPLEVSVQMLIFTGLFFIWEKRRKRIKQII